MFGRKKQPETGELNERPVLGYVEIAGIGKVEVSSVPSQIPSKVMMGNQSIKISRELYKYLWALTYATSEGQKKLSSIV